MTSKIVWLFTLVSFHRLVIYSLYFLFLSLAALMPNCTIHVCVQDIYSSIFSLHTFLYVIISYPHDWLYDVYVSEQPCQEVYQFSTFNAQFCEDLLTVAYQRDQWSPAVVKVIVKKRNTPSIIICLLIEHSAQLHNLSSPSFMISNFFLVIQENMNQGDWNEFTLIF